MEYKCERCGCTAMLCVSDWGYVGALCERCLDNSKHFLKLPVAQPLEGAAERGADAGAARMNSP